MPQIKEMARKEGVARDKEKEKAEGKQIKADTVLQFLKDDQIKQLQYNTKKNYNTVLEKRDNLLTTTKDL